MNLYLLRHGIAEERNPLGSKPDPARQLTPEGIRKIERIACAMQSMELEFDVVLSSPFLRAVETARIVADKFEVASKLEQDKSLAPDGNPQQLITSLEKRGRKASHILLVGHEPYLSRLISLLVSGDTSLQIELKKGGLAFLEIRNLHYGRCAILKWLLTPGQLRSI